MARGFVYLVAVIDWFSRRVLAWRLSITMDSSFCIEALEEAIENHGGPEIFNTDQGSQFTSEETTEWTGRINSASKSTSCHFSPINSSRRNSVTAAVRV